MYIIFPSSKSVIFRHPSMLSYGLVHDTSNMHKRLRRSDMHQLEHLIIEKGSRCGNVAKACKKGWGKASHLATIRNSYETTPIWAASPSFLPLALQPHLRAVTQSRHALFKPVAGHAWSSHDAVGAARCQRESGSRAQSPRGAAKLSKTRRTLWLREASLPASEAHSSARCRTYRTLTRRGSVWHAGKIHHEVAVLGSNAYFQLALKHLARLRHLSDVDSPERRRSVFSEGRKLPAEAGAIRMRCLAIPHAHKLDALVIFEVEDEPGTRMTIINSSTQLNVDDLTPGLWGRKLTVGLHHSTFWGTSASIVSDKERAIINSR